MYVVTNFYLKKQYFIKVVCSIFQRSADKAERHSDYRTGTYGIAIILKMSIPRGFETRAVCPFSPTRISKLFSLRNLFLRFLKAEKEN